MVLTIQQKKWKTKHAWLLILKKILFCFESTLLKLNDVFKTLNLKIELSTLKIETINIQPHITRESELTCDETKPTPK